MAELLGEGLSFRQVAELLGLSLGAVQRAKSRAEKDGVPPVPGVPVPAAAAAGEVDPARPVLSDAELAYLGWSREHVAGGLNALELYRLQALGSYRDAGVALPERVVTSEPMPKHFRDALIVKLRRQGKSLSEIGAALVPKMSKGGVSRALARLEDDGDYNGDDDEDDVAPVAPSVRQRNGGPGRSGWRSGPGDW